MPAVLKYETKVYGYFINNYNVMYLILVVFVFVIATIIGILSLSSILCKK